MNDAETLRAAADLIRTGGLCKERLEDGTGAHCAVGAVIASGDFHQVDVWGRLAELAREMFPDRYGSDGDKSVVTFNNHRDTTAEDVIAVLEKAAVKEEEWVS